MSFVFSLPKVMQELGVLLAETPGQRFNYTMLLKMLYLADRESLAELGQPISGDKLYALPKGPVLSTICDLMRKSGNRPSDLKEQWSHFFETKGMALVAKQMPDRDLLSDYEIKKLKRLFAEHREKNLNEMFDFVAALPEVAMNKRGNSSREIPLEDLVREVGRGDSINEILQNKIEDEFLFQLLGH